MLKIWTGGATAVVLAAVTAVSAEEPLYRNVSAVGTFDIPVYFNSRGFAALPSGGFLFSNGNQNGSLWLANDEGASQVLATEDPDVIRVIQLPGEPNPTLFISGDGEIYTVDPSTWTRSLCVTGSNPDAIEPGLSMEVQFEERNTGIHRGFDACGTSEILTASLPQLLDSWKCWPAWYELPDGSFLVTTGVDGQCETAAYSAQGEQVSKSILTTENFISSSVSAIKRVPEDVDACGAEFAIAVGSEIIGFDLDGNTRLLASGLPDDGQPGTLAFDFAETIPDRAYVARYLATTGKVSIVEISLAKSCPGDLNGDNRIDSADLGLLIAAWSTDGSIVAGSDINGDGIVNAADLGLQIGNWGDCGGCD